MTFETLKTMKGIQKLVQIQNAVQEIEEGEQSVPDTWPAKGEIEFKDVYLRYRPNTDLALKGLNFKIKQGVKVGVVGRTGAGKSTLGLTLLRIMEIEKGNIYIDGVDIRKVELKTLRERITTIP